MTDWRLSRDRRLTCNSFFDNETLSNVTVYFSGYSLHAHKVILSSMSSYFKAAFTNGLEVRRVSDSIGVPVRARCWLFGVDCFPDRRHMTEKSL